MLTFINIPSARSWRRYFKTLNLHSDLLEGLKSINILAPTEIQRKAFPYIKEKDSVLVVSEPGSGKTLSYLVPIIDEYKKKFSTESSLFGLVFVPTTELAEQVTKVIKSLSHCVKIKSVFFRPTLPAATFLKRLEKDSPQLVVTTPFHFLKAIEKGAFKPFAKLRYVVVDETDSLIRDDFGRVMQKIFTLIKGACVKAVFVTATFYKPFCNELYHRFPRMKESVHVISDSLNLANYRVKYTFVRYSANSTERVEYLLRFLQGGRDLKTIIFCNTLRTAALLSSLLSKSRISHSYWNGSLLYTQRRQALQNFKEEGGVIVATDSLGRGLDFVNAQVVLFDFPRSVEEWVHRVGRTGRARSQGRVLCFYCKKSALLACEISNALNQGSLAALSSRVELPREFYFRAGMLACFYTFAGKDGRKVVFRPMPSPFYSQESASSASIEKIQNSDVKAKRVHVKIIDIRPSAIEKRRNKKGIRLSCHSSSSTATYRKARSPPSEGRMSRSLGNKRLDHLKKFQIYE